MRASKNIASGHGDINRFLQKTKKTVEVPRTEKTVRVAIFQIMSERCTIITSSISAMSKKHSCSVCAFKEQSS